jgi:hypothetical protein
MEKEIPLTLLGMSKILKALQEKDAAKAAPFLKEIQRRYNRTTRPLAKGATIAPLGKIAIPKTELRKRLTALGVGYSPKISAETTHLLVGHGAEAVDTLPEGIVVLTLAEVSAFFNLHESQYIAQATPEDSEAMRENLKQLLFSRDEANISIGLSMLSSGGVPTELLTHLFAVSINTRLNSNIRKKARQLVELNGSEGLKEKYLLKENVFASNINEKWLLSCLMKYILWSNLNLEILARYIYEQTGNGYEAWFASLSDERQSAEMQRLMQYPNYTPYLFGIWYSHTNAEDVQSLRRLSLSGSPQRSFCLRIYDFPNLEYLSLSRNVLKLLPKELVKFTKLAELDISGNYFSKFPPVLLQMPWLKKIHIGGNPFAETELPDPKIYDSSKKGLLIRID